MRHRYVGDRPSTRSSALLAGLPSFPSCGRAKLERHGNRMRDETARAAFLLEHPLWGTAGRGSLFSDGKRDRVCCAPSTICIMMVTDFLSRICVATRGWLAGCKGKKKRSDIDHGWI
ncbi:hypothetical protein BRADI_1g15795v3 [Brachypodium distachyon]|uniref:Uncharacterized protein n=1 Tax=Brachypodium distachyon TaxID=15368 RepID=A0A2K2DJP8_BRADI|nr:hypothetical protein BRADI_1g15795v3 [Brachypodium distachyon]